ncbi:ABC-type multidrug transport system fused ATPase/permease subunit [Enterobacter sp. BIGb0383]|uniref:ATP-binding cassette domain-containing protein n=1 Tax=unclassified Enterobacter TaxID=2608935 RepID=UPI000F48F14C|nr:MULTISPECIES: ABC transporter ATP-binding protein [unclassified Enterobacter]ROP59367.1 ABC-type multidrug transport system fused ATPase/permease subunit [Enterobacter sp. BIGb0383]ROS09167.1 ABC-type multidrug transport system fused ATPase/permease subunit [Enterobacter sp. BIGb0359]
MDDVIFIIRKSRIKLTGLFFCFLLAAITSFFSLLPEQFVSLILNSLSNNDIAASKSPFSFLTGETNQYHVLTYVFMFFIFSLLAILLKNYYSYLATVISEKIISNVRASVFKKLTTLKFDTQLKLYKGDVVNLVINDTARLSFIFERPFYTLLSDLVDFIFISIYLIIVDYKILIIQLLIVPLIYLASIVTGRKQRVVAKKTRDYDSLLAEKSEQLVSQFEKVKVHNGEAYENKNFGYILSKSLKTRVSGARSLALFFPIEGGARVLGVSIVMLYTIHNIYENFLPIGALAINLSYANKFFSPVRNIASYYQLIQKGIISCKEIRHLYSLDSENNEGAVTKTFNSIRISVKNLSLGFSERKLLNKLSFSCGSGEMLIVKGASGTGKTSLLRTILRLYHPAAGTIFLNDTDITTLDIEGYRSILTYISQNFYIDKENIIDNIAYPDSDIDHARALSIIKKLNLSHLLDSNCNAEDGKIFSGGEQLRISFGRCLYNQAPIVLLDEVFSNIDKQNIEMLINCISELLAKGTAIILVTHFLNERLTNMACRVIEMKDYTLDITKNL